MKKNLNDPGTYPPKHLKVDRMNRVMRHRLRNLCCGMKMALDRIAEQTQATLPHIADSCAVMDAEFQNLLTFTKRMDLLFDVLPAPEPRTLFQLLTEARQFFAEKFPFGNIELNGPEVNLKIPNGSLLEHALHELLANAGEACFDGVITLEWTHHSDLTFTVSNPHSEMLDEQPSHPEPFYTTRGRHDGLGLAIVQRIASAIDGSFSFEQDEDCTIIATVTVPKAQIES